MEEQIHKIILDKLDKIEIQTTKTNGKVIGLQKEMLVAKKDIAQALKLVSMHSGVIKAYKEEAFIQNLAGISYSTGDILYYDGTKLNKLQIGTEGHILTVDTGVPVWAVAPSVGGYTNLTEFVDQTAWRLFYSNTDGDIVELALGSNGTFLKSNGATSAPTWDTPASSGGDVSKVGTPVDNQIGVLFWMRKLYWYACSYS